MDTMHRALWVSQAMPEEFSVSCPQGTKQGAQITGMIFQTRSGTNSFLISPGAPALPVTNADIPAGVLPQSAVCRQYNTPLPAQRRRRPAACSDVPAQM